MEPSSSPLLPVDEAVTLSARKITRETCRKFGYVPAAHKGQPVQVASYRNLAGEVCAQHIRGRDKAFSWRGEARLDHLQLWGRHLWKDGGRKVVVTEGEIDCLTVSQLQGNKWPVVSLPSGAGSAVRAFKTNLEWLQSFESVVIMFDMDDPGRKAAKEAAALLPPGRAYIASLPRKDPNECLLAGQGDAVISAIWNAAPYRPDGIVAGADLWDKLRLPPESGAPLAWPTLSDMVGGVRPRELWMFTAGSGVGKSTGVNELAYDLLMNRGWTVGVMALEESTIRAAERYVGMYLNRPIHLSREGVDEDELRAAFEATAGSGRMWFYDHFGSTSLDNLMGKIRYMAVSLGCRLIVLDHVSIVVSGLDEAEESERKTIDKLMTRLRSTVEETGVTVFAIVHLKRPDKGKSYNEGRQVSLTDLRGSGGLEQLSDVVVALERNQQDEQNGNVARVRVLKNRATGVVGPADFLEYHPDPGRLLVSAEPNPFNPPGSHEPKGGDEDF